MSWCCKHEVAKCKRCGKQGTRSLRRHQSRFSGGDFCIWSAQNRTHALHSIGSSTNCLSTWARNQAYPSDIEAPIATQLEGQVDQGTPLFCICCFRELGVCKPRNCYSFVVSGNLADTWGPYLGCKLSDSSLTLSLPKFRFHDRDRSMQGLLGLWLWRREKARTSRLWWGVGGVVKNPYSATPGSTSGVRAARRYYLSLSSISRALVIACTSYVVEKELELNATSSK